MTVPSAITDNEELGALRAALSGRFVLERELGRGGMGVVYLAREKSLDRQVALKVLPGTLMAQPVLRERFLRETRLVANMSHPNVVPIYAVEEHPGVIFYAMGFIDGETLTDRVRRIGPLPSGDVVRVLQEAAWALSYAHSRGIVHRDVKPDNILIERATGRTLLLDFGISRVADSTMTSLGETLGTPQFMSPEQAAGEPADARSDVYSLGLVGFFALTGHAPFDAPTVQGVLAMQVTQPAPPIAVARPGTPRGLAVAVDRCLAKSPNDRWPSAEALVAALQQARDVSAQDIAPPVRNFQRTAEMTSTTLITLLLLLPAIAVAQPQAADTLLAILGVFTGITLLQLASHARRLRDQGFAYEDVRAAFNSDARAAREAADVARNLPRGSKPRMVARGRSILLVLGIAMLAAGIALATRVHVRSTLGAVATGLMAAGILLTVTIALLKVFSGGLGRGANRIAVALWRTGAGRLFFRLVAAPRSGASRSRAGPTPPAPGQAVLAMLRDLPGPLRKQLGDVRTTVTRIDGLAAAIDARERELDRALAEVGPGDAAVGAGTKVAQDRATLLDDLHRTRDLVVARRDELRSELEHLRLSVVRVRAGVGTPNDVLAALEQARAVASEVDGNVPPVQDGALAAVPAPLSRPS